MVYDWVLLLIPAVLFWQEREDKQDQLKVIYAFLWGVMFFSGALTYAQWTAFGKAVQLSIPALLVALILLPLMSKHTCEGSSTPMKITVPGLVDIPIWKLSSRIYNPACDTGSISVLAP
jgi:hypothetical protein